MRNTEIADVLKAAAVDHWLRKGYSSHVELGLNRGGKLRADVVSVNLRGNIVVSEIKSSIRDYRSDIKWKQYAQFCNKCVFVMRDSTYARLRPEEIKDIRDHGVGIMVLDATSGYLRAVKPSKNRQICPVLHLTLVIRMAWRQGESKRVHNRRRHFIGDSHGNQKT